MAKSPIEKATGWRLFIKTVIARAYPRIIGQQREKSWLFFDVFLPLLAVSAYVFVYRAIGAPERDAVEERVEPRPPEHADLGRGAGHEPPPSLPLPLDVFAPPEPFGSDGFDPVDSEVDEPPSPVPLVEGSFF